MTTYSMIYCTVTGKMDENSDHVDILIDSDEEEEQNTSSSLKQKRWDAEALKLFGWKYYQNSSLPLTEKRKKSSSK